jgi:hypothetical protein
MLGEQLGQASGKVTGIRVIPTDGPETKLEISFQGTGKMLGLDIMNIGTYRQVVGDDGVIRGDGEVVVITADGQSAHWVGFGVGHPTGPSPKSHFAVCGYFKEASEQFRQLTRVANVVEYEVPEDSEFRGEMWEWY